MAKSKIEWTDTTWNPITGCTKISAGCKNCYAETMTRRLKAMGQEKYKDGFNTIRVHQKCLNDPLNWKKPCQVFVNSMSDLFHDDVPTTFIQEVFSIMNKCPQHIFQVLTKRAKRLEDISQQLKWSPNIWMGVTVENKKVFNRIGHLRNSGAHIKFLSMEPLLEKIPTINLKDIDWMIVGGESGPGARSIKEDWVKDLRDQCLYNKVAFFFKQWGGVNKKKAGRLLESKIWDQSPLMAY